MAVPDFTAAAPKHLIRLGVPGDRVIQSFQPVGDQWFVSKVGSGNNGDDTRIYRLDATGELLDWCTLAGGGHGSTMGYTTDGTDVWLWFWWRTDTTGGTYTNRCVKWKYRGSAEGITVTRDDADVVELTDLWGDQYVTYSIDQANDLVAVDIRDSATATRTTELRKLSEYEAGTGNALHTVGPINVDYDAAYQGHTFDSDRLYVARGNVALGRPLTLHSYDWTSGAEQILTVTSDVYTTGDWLEIEGVAMHPTHGLLFGIATGPLGGRIADVYQVVQSEQDVTPPSTVNTFSTDTDPSLFLEQDVDGAPVRLGKDSAVLVRSATDGTPLPATKVTNELGYLSFTTDGIPGVQVCGDDGQTWKGPFWSQESRASAITGDLMGSRLLDADTGIIKPIYVPPVTVDKDALDAAVDDYLGGDAAGLVQRMQVSATQPPAPSTGTALWLNPGGTTWAKTQTAAIPAVQGIAWNGTDWNRVVATTLYEYDTSWAYVAMHDMSADVTASTSHFSAPLAKDGYIYVPVKNTGGAIIGRWSQSDLSFVDSVQVTNAPDDGSACLGWDPTRQEYLIGGYYSDENTISRYDDTFTYIGPISVGADSLQGIAVLGDQIIMSADNVNGGDTGTRPRGLYACNRDGTGLRMIANYSADAEMEGCCIGPGSNDVTVAVKDPSVTFRADTHTLTASERTLKAYDPGTSTWFAIGEGGGSGDYIRADLLTTKGDLVVMGNSGISRLPAPDDGTLLMADSTSPLGWVQAARSDDGNLAMDPGFDGGADGWIAYSGSDAPVVDDDHFYRPPQSLKLSKGSGTAPAFAVQGQDRIPQPGASDAGRVLTCSVWMYVPTGSADPMLRVDTGSTSAEKFDSDPMTAKDTWTQATVNYTIPTSGPSRPITIWVRTANASDAITMWIDSASYVMGPK